MTGMSEISPIGETPSVSVMAGVEGSGSLLPEEGAFAQAKAFDFVSADADKETLRWENFKDAPKSLADAVKSLGEGMRGEVRVKSEEGIVKSEEIIGNSEEVRGKMSPWTKQPTDAPEKVKLSEGCSRKESPERARAAARVVPDAQKGDVFVEDKALRIVTGEEVHGRREDRVPLQEAVVAIQAPVVQMQTADVGTQISNVDFQTLRAQFAAAVNTVVEALAVSPALAATGEGEIRIQLKADVLDGSSIKLEAKGGELKIIVTPASRAAEETLLRHHESFQAHLAERVVNWRINVGVAALGPRHTGNYRSEEES